MLKGFSSFPAVLGAAGFVGAYDAIPNIIAAYGMRRLLSSYESNLLRIRRGSDNVEQDFGYVANGDLDVDAVATFIGGGSGFYPAVYEQVASKDFLQTSAAVQPLYEAAGLGSRPTIARTAAGQLMDTNAFTAINQPITYLMAVSSAVDTNERAIWLDCPTTANRHSIFKPLSDTYVLFAGGNAIAGVYTAGIHIMAAIYNGASSLLYVDGGAAVISDDVGANDVTAWRLFDNFSGNDGGQPVRLSELVAISGVPSDADINAVANNMAVYYGGVWSDI